jgi:tryptophan 2,3-dioxygenase
LIDLEDAFRKWRFAHVATVSRVIGSNIGTGGSSGLKYLMRAANQLFEDPMYPELWDVRNEMFSRPQEFDLAAAGYTERPSPQPSPRKRGEGGTRGAGG